MPASVTLKALSGRTCSKCEIYKDSSHFYFDKKNNNLYSVCYECKKKYRDENKDKSKKWHHENYKVNKEQIYLQHQEWIKNNPEKMKEINDRSRNKPENKLKRRKYRNEYYHKNKHNPLFFLAIKVRNRLRAALKAKNWRKNTKFNEYIGCSLENLKLYLESQFIEGMTWENYGHGKDKWTIDHIIPISLGKNPEEMCKLNHYTNLQPMWYLDNIKKSDTCPLL